MSAYDYAEIKRARRVKGWSQGYLARLLNIPQPRLSELENGKHAKPETVKLVADVLGLDMEKITLREEARQ